MKTKQYDVQQAYVSVICCDEQNHQEMDDGNVSWL